MSLIEQTEERIHSRAIEISTYSCKNGQGIIVEGRLKDDRLITNYRLSGEQVPAGTIHHMIIRMRVSGVDFKIQDIEAEMPGVPRDECPETAQSLSEVKGWAISPGFTERVKNAIGGKAGCAHLTALLLAMAPAAVQGYWAYLSRKPRKDKIPADLLSRYLIDTCWVWRREGKRAQELLKMAAQET